MRHDSSKPLLLVLLLLLASSASAVFAPLFVNITNPEKPDALGYITITSVAGMLSIECTKTYYSILVDDISCTKMYYSLNGAPLLIPIKMMPLSQPTTSPVYVYVDVPTKIEQDIRLATSDCLQPLPDDTCRYFIDSFNTHVDMCNARAKDANEVKAISKGDSDCFPLPPMPTPSSSSSFHTTAVTTASVDTAATMLSLVTDRTTTTTTTTRPKGDGGSKILHDLADAPITSDNVTEVLRETLSVVKAYKKLTPGDIFAFSLILEHATALANLTAESTTLVLENVDVVLNADADIFRESSKAQSSSHHFDGLDRRLQGHESAAADAAADNITPSQRILDALETLVWNSQVDDIRFLNSTNLGFRSSKLRGTCSGGDPFTLVDRKDSFSNNSKDANAEGSRSISLPGDVICHPNASYSIVSITRSLKLHSSPSKNYASISIYPTGRRERQITDPSACELQMILVDGGVVLAATLLGYKEGVTNGRPRRISRLASRDAPMARIQLNDMKHAAQPLHGSYGVTWWTGQGWSEKDQCTVTQTAFGIAADCPHLTDFTLLIDGIMDDPMVCSHGIVAFSEVLGVLSIFSLLAVILFTVVRIAPDIPQARTVRRVLPWLIGPRTYAETADLDGALLSLAHLSALFAFHTLFAIFSFETMSGPACSIFAALNYSLLIITITFTLFASLRTLLLFFRTAGQNSSSLLSRVVASAIRVLTYATRVENVLSISAGVPLVVSTLLLAFTPFFNRNDGLCWVRPDYIAPAVILPTTITVVNGSLCLALISFRILPVPGRDSFTQLMTSHDIFKRISSLFLMQFTLGIPWCVQFFSLYYPHVSFWHVLFTFVIGSQGVVMLLLYLYKILLLTRTNAREENCNYNNNIRNEESSPDKKESNSISKNSKVDDNKEGADNQKFYDVSL